MELQKVGMKNLAPKNRVIGGSRNRGRVIGAGYDCIGMKKIGLINRVIRGSRRVIRGQLIFTVMALMAETTDIIGSKSCNIQNASMQHKTLEYPSIYSFKLLINQKPHKMTQKYPKIQNSFTSARS